MKIKYQLALIITGISVLVALLISTLFFYSVKKTVMQQTFNHLEAISETKKNKINSMIMGKHELISVLGNKRFLQYYIDYLEVNSPQNHEALLDLMYFYKNRLKTVNEVHILDTNGIYIISTDPTFLHTQFKNWDKEKQKYLRGLYAKDFFYNKTQTYNIASGVPLISNHKTIGVLLVYQSAEDIFSVTREYAGLRKTGETILAKREGKTGYYLSPLRFDPDAVRTRRTTAGDSVISEVLQGSRGIIWGTTDYRGKKVIASARDIPATNWVLVTKIDKKEVMKPLVRLLRVLIVLNLVVILFSLLFSFIIAQFITRSISELARSAQQIQEGNYQERALVKDKNEIGALALTFNQMADNLERKMLQLNNSNESLNKFAYVISHDLRVPLASIKGLVQLLVNGFDEKEPPEGQKQMLTMLSIKVNQMEEMIINVLDTAKKGSSAEQIKELINVKELIENIINNISNPLHISIIIQEPLPAIVYHKTALIQIFQNLISNAIKYNDMPNGFVLISGEKMDKKMKYCVKDNGRGIKPENLDKIFGMFNRVDSGDFKVESSGIGLSIVKKLVTENRGEIWVESVEGEGSIFCFTVPVENPVL